MENVSGKVQFGTTQDPLESPSQVERANLDEGTGMTSSQKRTLIIIVVFILVLLAVSFLGIWYLLQPTTDAARWRDVFIILMALQSMLTGISLVILMLQLARLIVLLQNEIKPILDSTNETVSSLRGTTMFLSDNLVGPVIKLNEYMAGFAQLISLVGLGKKTRRKSTSR